MEDHATPAPEPIVIRLTLDRSVRISRVLEEAGLDSSRSRKWGDLFQDLVHTRLLISGHLLSLYKDPETGDLRGFRYDADERTAVVEQGYANGVVITGERPIQYVVRTKGAAFEVRENFERAAARRDVPKAVVEALANAFTDVRPIDKLPPGTGVKLLYTQQISRDRTHQLPGELEAAQISVGGRLFKAFAFRDEHGRPHLYDEHGKPLGPQVLRFPLPFEYISSGFSYSRWHPILHEYRPHVGIDLVAQYGTPVKAIADGRIIAAEWCGELGKCVRIEHDHGMVSVYGHLSRISPSARPGSYVRVGEVIGLVGSTGLSTGPHLHFALLREGRYVNPLNEKLGANHGVSPRLRGLFDGIKHRYLILLAKLPSVGGSKVFAADRKPAISPLGDLYHVQVRHRFPMHHRRSHRIRSASLETTSTGGM